MCDLGAILKSLKDTNTSLYFFNANRQDEGWPNCKYIQPWGDKVVSDHADQLASVCILVEGHLERQVQL